jgi:hypothetical protein
VLCLLAMVAAGLVTAAVSLLGQNANATFDLVSTKASNS